MNSLKEEVKECYDKDKQLWVYSINPEVDFDPDDYILTALKYDQPLPPTTENGQPLDDIAASLGLTTAPRTLYERQIDYLYETGPYDLPPGGELKFVMVVAAGVMDFSRVVEGGLENEAHLKDGADSLWAHVDAAIELYNRGYKCPVPPPTPTNEMNSLTITPLSEGQLIKIQWPPIPDDYVDRLEVFSEIEAGISNPSDMYLRAMLKFNESKADIIILMFDGSIPLSEEDHTAVSLVKGKNFIPVINKVDLPLVISKEEIAKLTGKEPMLISCLTHEGIENLKNKLSNEFKKPNVKKLFYISLREKNILTEVLRNLKASLKETLTIDEVSIEIGEAIRKLKLLVGEEFDPDVTKEIFSRFCIGK